ncbi:MAG: hypothetical protein ACR2I7_00280, partial [Geodermatophilaceae bacterium]
MKTSCCPRRWWVTTRTPRWYDGQAFATVPKGEFIFDAISREAFEDAVGAIVHDQEAAGFD